jgi:thiamine pyrophosphokinase
MIVGDLDSLRDDVKAYYESMGSKIQYIDNQDNTDFEKIINSIDSIETDNGNRDYNIVAEGAFGGRMD